MLDVDFLRALLAWCTVINIGIYLLIVTVLWLFRDFAYRMNGRIFALPEQEVARLTMQYVGLYKLAITVLCFTPWAALKILS